MSPRPILAAALAALLAAPALAASPFDGTWKTDTARSKLSERPEVISLAGGTYRCDSCIPAWSVPADGKFHPVAGSDYFDAASARAEGPRAVSVTTRKGDRTVAVNRMSVSADGKLLTYDARRTNPLTGKTAASVMTASRVAAAPEGAHAISGSWQAQAIQSASDGAALQTIRVEGDSFTLSTPTGEGYTATFGGAPVVQKNDPARTMIAVQRIADDHIVETDTRDGKVVMTYDMTVAADGRTMTMVVTDRRNNSTDTIVMTRQ